jgi:tetratricopeptide (TPR) repeat protein
MQTDRYALPLSTSSQAARDAYVTGCDCILSAVAGVETNLARALEADPQFALAHVAVARGHFVLAEVPQARAAAATARSLAQSATPREQSHVNAIALAIEGNANGSLEASKAHLAQWPRDAMVLAPATGVFGLVGFSGRQEREPELYQLLARLALHYGGDWWFECVLAFAACECGKLDEALTLIERSMAGNARNAHGAHIKVHVLYEMGEDRAALDYLEAWMPGLDKKALLHCHLSWHVALFALALGNLSRAWEVYRRQVHPGGSWGPALNAVTDSAAFLWRAELAGQPRDEQLWREARDYALKSFPKAGIFFADVHTALACVASGDSVNLERLVAGMKERVASGKYAAGSVVPAIAEGFAKFANRDWNGAIRQFEQALPATVRIGGSRAQRDLIENTLLAAYLRAGRPQDAKKLIARRLDRRPMVMVEGYASA